MINFENKVGFENNLFPTIFFYWKWTRIVPSHMVFIQKQPLHQSSQSRKGAKNGPVITEINATKPVTDAVHLYSVGGVFKVTLRSLVSLSLLTIRIPYVYDVSADESIKLEDRALGERGMLITEASAVKLSLSEEAQTVVHLMAPDTH